MRLRAGRIIFGALERAIDAAVPLAVRRWYKHRPACPAAPLIEGVEFQAHLREIISEAVVEAIDEVLDLDEADESGDVPLRPCEDAIAVYRGGAGWRWAIVREGKRTAALSPYHMTRSGALGEARWLADLTGLHIEITESPPEAAA